MRIGLLPEEAASDVVEYHSLLWQFYEKAKVLNRWTEPDDTGERDALIADIRTIMGRIRTVGGRRAEGAVLTSRDESGRGAEHERRAPVEAEQQP